MKFTRRDFIKTVVASTTGIYFTPITGCGNGLRTDDVFPQGIASGDPKPESIILWTRVNPENPLFPESVQYEVSLDERFSKIIAHGTVDALPQYDHTVRIKVTGLNPFTYYYYRFISRGVPSRRGRTLTAPAPDMECKCRFAFASCQDYVGRYYHSWKLLADEGEKSEPLHFIIFLGDYIYEYETGSDVTLSGNEKRRVEIPDGLLVNNIKAAWTLNDYRALYKKYKSDKNLQRIHELYSFIAIWDDHEFANDCWQDHANDFNGLMGDEKETERRKAATKAFYEYIPLDLDYNESTDFPGDITLYRSLRFGKHVEIFLTDQRYYRSDHVVREDEVDPEVGKFLKNSALGSRVLAVKDGFDIKEAGAGVTMLGIDQFNWLIQSLKNSTATWKFIASPTMMMQMVLDLTSFENLPPLFKKVFYFKLDQWDGYRTERANLLKTLKNISNIVVISGDIHGFYAGELYEDFDNPSEPIAVEFVVAGISSSPVREQVQKIVETNPLLKDYFTPLLPLFDSNILQSNPHIKYTNGYGYGAGIVDINGSEEITVTFMEIPSVSEESPVPEPSFKRFNLKSGTNKINSA